MSSIEWEHLTLAAYLLMSISITSLEWISYTVQGLLNREFVCIFLCSRFDGQAAKLFRINYTKKITSSAVGKTEIVGLGLVVQSGLGER